MIKEQTIAEFLEVLSSKQPVPGGGGASALAGALGTALGLMVGNLTVGKKKYAAVEADVRLLMERLERLREELAELADEDARVFAPLAAAYGLPSGTEEEKAHKAAVMEENLLAASLVPVRIMEKAVETLAILKELEEKGSVMAVSDVGVAVQFARTALTGAVMNVYINTKSMKNRQTAQEINEKAEQMLAEGISQADSIYGKVLERLNTEPQTRSIDRYSYELGVMDCFCEMVSAGLKTLAMSHPCDTKEERDGYQDEVERLCRQYQIRYYAEDDAFLTDLFPEEMNRDKFNYLFYRTEDVLEQYLELKERKRAMVGNGTYTGQNRTEIARAFGRLLSYPEEGIDRLIQRAKKQ